jgi:opacity protein-like surface antigen
MAILLLLPGAALADGYSKHAMTYNNAVRADHVDWTGLYAGLHSGGVQGKTVFVRDGAPVPTPCAPCTAAQTYAIAYRSLEFSSQTKREVEIDGFHIGPHIGYQWQRGNIVLGGDIGFSVGGGEGSVDCTSAGAAAGDSVRCESEYKYSVNARARLGFARGNYLFYLTGGVVRAKIENRVRYFGAADNSLWGEAGSAHPNGWLAGLGIEYQSANGMRWGLGYTHIFLNDVQVNLVDALGGGGSTKTTPDPDVLGGSLKVPLQQQAPQIQDPGPPAAQAPAIAQAPRPAVPPARVPAAAQPRPATPPAAATPAPGAPPEPDEPAPKGRPRK